MIRPVTPDDASAIVDIYNHYVATTTISFEEHPVTPDEMAGRIRDVTAALPWFVYESEGKVAGYAYATKWRARSAYRFSAETSVYVAPGQGGKGIGSALYKTLLEELRAREIHMAIGGIAQPNPASVASIASSSGVCGSSPSACSRRALRMRSGWRHRGRIWRS